MSGSDSVSPTAHYTGYVWFRNGLSDPALATREGQILFDSLQPAALASRMLGGPTLEGYLLARHAAIDTLLTRAIEDDGVTQVLELAAGLSPRGLRFHDRYGDGLTYIEADLPGMVARKRRALEGAGVLGDTHRVVELDVLKAGALEALTDQLSPDGGLVVITEGLLGYLPTDEVTALWGRLADALARFRVGRYISELHLASIQTPAIRAFRLLLSVFVRGNVHLHYDSIPDAETALRAAGFDAVAIRRATDIVAESRDARRAQGPGAGLAHIIEASTSQ